MLEIYANVEIFIKALKALGQNAMFCSWWYVSLFVISGCRSRCANIPASPHLLDIHSYMLKHQCTVTANESSSQHMLGNPINHGTFRTTGVWDKNMFSRIHLPAGITHSLNLHSSHYDKYMVHEPLTEKDTRTETDLQFEEGCILFSLFGSIWLTRSAQKRQETNIPSYTAEEEDTSCHC